MKILRALLVLAFSSVAIAQGTAPPTSILGSIGITGGQSLRGQNTLSATSLSFPYTLGPNQWWAYTQYVTGTLTANSTIILPLNQGQEFSFINVTSGGYNLIVGGSSGNTVTVPNGATISVVCDGTNYRTGSSSFTIGGTNGQVQYNNAGVLGGLPLVGVGGGGVLAAPATPLVTGNALIAGTSNGVADSGRQPVNIGAAGTYLIGNGAAAPAPGYTATAPSALVFGPSGSGHTPGLVPDPGATAGTTRYLREDGTFATPAGSGGGASTPATSSLLKGNGSANGVVAAVSGTDYDAPGAAAAVQTASAQKSQNLSDLAGTASGVPNTAALDNINGTTTATQINPSSLSRSYDSVTGLPTYLGANAYDLNLDTAYMPRLTACLAGVKAGTRDCVIVAPGDSTTEGVYCTGNTTGDFSVCSWPHYLAQYLNAHGYPAQDDATLGNGTSFQTTCANDARWACNGFTSVNAQTVGGNFITASSAVTGAVFSPRGIVDSVTVPYGIFSANGVLGVACDSDTATTVNTAGGTTSEALITVACSKGPGIHKFTFTWVSGGAVTVGGAMAFNSTVHAVRIVQAGWAGSTSSNWNSVGPGYGPKAAMVIIAPDAVLMPLGINDLKTTGVTATYKANMLALATAWQPTMDVVLVTQYPSNVSYGAGFTQAAQAANISSDYEVARALSLPLIDVWDRWGGNAATPGYNTRSVAPFNFYGDTTASPPGLHPNAAGQSDQAGIIASRLVQALGVGKVASSNPTGSETVTYSATAAFSASTADSQIILTGNLAFTIPAGLDTQPKTINFCDDATGGRVVTAPSNVIGFSIGTTANTCYPVKMNYYATQAVWEVTNAPGSGGITAPYTLTGTTATPFTVSGNTSFGTSVGITNTNGTPTTWTVQTNGPSSLGTSLSFVRDGAVSPVTIYAAGSTVNHRLVFTTPLELSWSTYAAYSSTATLTQQTGLNGFTAGVVKVDAATPGGAGGSIMALGTANQFGAITTGTNPYITGTSSGSVATVAMVAAAAGHFSIPVGASGGTIVVNSTAITANSEVSIEPVTATSIGTSLGVTCATPTAVPIITGPISQAAGTATFNASTFTGNPACYQLRLVTN